MAGTSEDNVQGWKIVRKMSSWPRGLVIVYPCGIVLNAIAERGISENEVVNKA